MRAAIITIAGISSRFNEGIPEEEKKHKIIYSEGNKRDTLLFHLLAKCSYADKIILVGGSRYEDVKEYCDCLPAEMQDRIVLTYNSHYSDLGSGYSLYLGLKELSERFSNVKDVLFVEGDLDIDKESFDRVVEADRDVLTYCYEPIYANKAVVLYKDDKDRFRYAFNSSHGMLTVSSPFSCILNSGQMWKFTDTELLYTANKKFFSEEKEETNLKIIQNYIDLRGSDKFELIGLNRWTNCNTRQDYRKILTYWKEETE